MKQEDEENLVGYANNLIEYLKLTAESVSKLSLRDFYIHIDKEIPATGRSLLFRAMSENLGNQKLGVFIGLRPMDTNGYTKARFIQTFPCDILVETRAYKSGHEQLVKLASAVVIAAMYDILLTEASMLGEKGLVPYKVSYVPKEAMKRFVKKNRIKIPAVR